VLKFVIYIRRDCWADAVEVTEVIIIESTSWDATLQVTVNPVVTAVQTGGFET